MLESSGYTSQKVQVWFHILLVVYPRVVLDLACSKHSLVIGCPIDVFEGALLSSHTPVSRLHHNKIISDNEDKSGLQVTTSS